MNLTPQVFSSLAMLLDVEQGWHMDGLVARGTSAAYHASISVRQLIDAAPAAMAALQACIVSGGPA